PPTRSMLPLAYTCRALAVAKTIPAPAKLTTDRPPVPNVTSGAPAGAASVSGEHIANALAHTDAAHDASFDLLSKRTPHMVLCPQSNARGLHAISPRACAEPSADHSKISGAAVQSRGFYVG
ncbi:MAG TPA: hypothetical protein PLF40_26840, partial [Kofleriaceae bacterium]|nr:hypothetical protein [Kofleriaceae bacterium]